MSYSEMGHTCIFLTAKIFTSKTGIFFLSVVIQQVQVRLYSASWVNSAVTEGFQQHRAAFQNKLVFISPLEWHRARSGLCCQIKLKMESVGMEATTLNF